MSKERLERTKKRKQFERATLRRVAFGFVTAAIVCLATFLIYQQVSAVGKRPAYGEGLRFGDIEIDASGFQKRLERKSLLHSIDSYLAKRNSPLSGEGELFVEAQEATGVSAALLVGLLEAESSCGTNGSLSLTNHNGFGMKGPQPALGIPAENGYCWWPDWPSAVRGAADFVFHYWGPAQTGIQLKGYAASGGQGSSWLSRVESAREEILKSGKE